MLDCPSPSKAFLSACVSANSSPKMLCPGSWQHAMNLFCTHSAEMRCRSWEFSRVTLVCAAPLYLSRHFFGAQPDCLADTRLLVLFFVGVFFLSQAFCTEVYLCSRSFTDVSVAHLHECRHPSTFLTHIQVVMQTFN